MPEEEPLSNAARWTRQPPPLDAALDLEWTQEGDEWLRHLASAVTAAVTSQSFSTEGWSDPKDPSIQGRRCFLQGSKLQSSLLLIASRAGLHGLIEGAGDATDEQIEPWRAAVIEATRQVGQDHKDFRWTALVGTRPILGPNLALESDARVGLLRLVKATTALQEGIPMPLPTLSGHQLHEWWPVAVEGETRGYDWSVAALRASQEVKRLCGLLSVATDGCWTLRETPGPEWRGAEAIPASCRISRRRSREVPAIGSDS